MEIATNDHAERTQSPEAVVSLRLVFFSSLDRARGRRSRADDGRNEPKKTIYGA